jgi:hypothetical protein
MLRLAIVTMAALVTAQTPRQADRPKNQYDQMHPHQSKAVFKPLSNIPNENI